MITIQFKLDNDDVKLFNDLEAFADVIAKHPYRYALILEEYHKVIEHLIKQR